LLHAARSPEIHTRGSVIAVVASASATAAATSTATAAATSTAAATATSSATAATAAGSAEATAAAAAAEATTAAATKAAATAARAWTLALLGFIHGNATTVEFRPIQLFDGTCCRSFIHECHKAESAGAAGLCVRDYHCIFHFAETLEGCTKRPLIGAPAEASDEQFLCHYLSLLRHLAGEMPALWP
jgi:nucleoid-associated protein YgaU